MIALDTNVLISLRSKDKAENRLASAALTNAAQIGPVCICGAVFSELLGFPGIAASDLRGMFEALSIEIDWKMDESVWEAAGLAYQGYVKRRMASGSGASRLLLTDFLIGAHAFERNFTLLTTDKGIYRAAYPQLKVQSF